jgi:hypothetical protein
MNWRGLTPALGYDDVPNADLIALAAQKRPERLEALVTKGLANDAGAPAAPLGAMPPSSFKLSRLFEEYQAATRDEFRDLSPDQYLMENGLRPTKDHSAYSLRHSFRDRLVAVETPDTLMGPGTHSRLFHRRGQVGDRERL